MAVKGAAKFPTGPKGSRVLWYDNPFDAGSARELILHLKKGLASHTAGFANEVEKYAKDNAPWADRTGDARSGLTAQGEQRLVRYTITLYHTVDYGVWLEIRWGGRFAIIEPTIRVMGERLMADLDLAELIREGGG